jgi:hypothetical protein
MKRLWPITLMALCAGSALAAEPWDEATVGTSMTYEEAVRQGQSNPDDLIARGRSLFTGKFTREDGAGRPKATQAILPTKRKRGENAPFLRTGGPDASACSGCHNDPIVGAAGEFVANVFVSEGFESADFDSIDPQFSNERNTNTLTGAGLVELLAREMTAELKEQRAGALAQARSTGQDVVLALASKGVSYGKIVARPDGTLDVSGLEGVDTDLVIRPFSQKGVFASIRQFTINALNAHHGIQATERFGQRWTGSRDFDEDGKPDELNEGDVTALTVFQASLGPPGRRTGLPAEWTKAAARGEKAFDDLGCTACHRTSLPLKSLVFQDPGPLDGAGTLRAADVTDPLALDLGKLPWAASLKRNSKGEWLVPLFGDLKRHVIVDGQVDALGNELMGQRFVERDVFMTAELWGIGSTAPYGHRGDFTTLDNVIRAHGGEGRTARNAYAEADDATRSSLIAFLRSLEIQK